MRTLTTLATLLLATHVAAAQTPDKLDDDVGPKDPETATWLSIGGSAIGPALIGVSFLLPDSSTRIISRGDAQVFGGLAMLLGPSAGHWYGGEFDRQIGWRAIGLGVGLTIASVGALGEDNKGNISPEGMNVVYTGLGVAAAIGVGSAIYDIATAGSTARRYNREHRLAVVPTMAHGDQQVTTGVALAGSW